MGLIRWLADRVQSETGEKERRKNVSRIKMLVLEFKDKVSESIIELNKSIEQFNFWIRALNCIRKEKIGVNIRELNHSLINYGNCKPVEAYIREDEKNCCEFPEESYSRLEDYVGDIDWSNEEVFWNTFLLSPLGMRHKTRKENIQLLESANDLELLISETLKEIDIKIFSTELETSICQSYIENIVFISEIISKTIIPELRIIDAFFQAEKIKNMVLCDKELVDVEFEYNITSLIETRYEEHYQFIKNAFAFYVMACKIYDTPVLSRLLQHKSIEDDMNILKIEKDVLKMQSDRVQSLVCFK